MDDSPRGFLLYNRWDVASSLAAIANSYKSAFAGASMLAREPKRTANGIQKLVMASLLSFLPILLGRRKRESEQISRRGKQAAAHAQTKRGPFHKARRRITGGGQPLATFLGEPRGHRIGLHYSLDLAG